jgi:late competence protein required for DNA uptake (superfamily II DNA/RNA helicase)
MAWLCVKDNKLANIDMCIITAPRINLATDLITRIKKLFYDKLTVEFESDQTTVFLNNVRIRAFLSHNISAVRGLPNLSFLFVDEVAFIPDNQIREVLDVCEWPRLD